jgi:hypothetical protein
MTMTTRLLLLALLVLAPVSCQSEGTVSAPVVRVDLRAKLPPRVQRLVALADTSYECRKPFQLSAGGAEQAFLAIWRVFEDGAGRYVTAVEVNPEGPTRGAGAPSASALVEELQSRKQGQQLVMVAPVRVTWTASKGCGKVKAGVRLELRADDPACQKPRGPGRLLTPVP